MKTIAAPPPMRSLRRGQSLVGIKAGARPKKTAKEWQAEARALLSKDAGFSKVDTVAVLRELRK